MSRAESIAVLCLVIPPLAIGCGGSERRAAEPKELETVDVGEAYDASLTTDTDQKERRVRSDIGGVLPSDFPEHLPVFTPSSIVDLGHSEAGSGFVEVDTAVPISEVRSSLAARLQQSGWQVEAIGEGGNTYQRDGRRVRVTLSELGSGTRIRYEY